MGLQLCPCLLLLRVCPWPRRSLPRSADSAPVCQPRHLTAILLQALNRKIKNALLVFVFVMCYLCEKCYKHIRVQHDLAGCVSWVPRLTLLDLQEQIRLANLLLKWNLLVWRGLTAVKI